VDAPHEAMLDGRAPLEETPPKAPGRRSGLSDLAEEERNRILRRADWRFLLPDPVPGTSICFGEGLLAEAVEAVSRRVLDPTTSPDGVCDLAVCLDPEREQLEAAFRTLRPGGACYSEWYSPLAGGPPGVRRRLEAAGFRDVVCYWAWPWPSRGAPKHWVPLEACGAVRYFLASQPRSPRFALRASRAALRGFWRIARWLHLALPVCAVARRPFLSAMLLHAGRTETGLEELIRARWNEWGLGPPPRNLSWLLLTRGPRTISKAVSLVFAEPAPWPQLAVKLARVAEAAPGLAREEGVLRAVHVSRPGGLPGVPRVLFRHDHPGFWALGETALVGVPLLTRLHAGNYRELAVRATDWLAELAGRPARRSRAEWWGRLVEPVLGEFERSFATVIDPGMLRETEAILAALGDMPLVCEQRDFSPWNVLVDAAGALVVLDWESAELHGLPALDLVYFLSYLTFFRDGAIESGRFRDSYRATLDPSTPIGALRRECMERYSSRIGLEPNELRPLELLLWMLHSRSEYAHFTADAGGPPERERLRRSLFVGLWKEELRRGGWS
jgi:hypothetical protein